MAQYSEGEGFDFEDDESVRKSMARSQEDGDANPNFTHLRTRFEIDFKQDQIVEEKKQKMFDTRFGGNYVNVQDPNKPNYTPFYLMVTGHIASG